MLLWAIAKGRDKRPTWSETLRQKMALVHFYMYTLIFTYKVFIVLKVHVIEKVNNSSLSKSLVITLADPSIPRAMLAMWVVMPAVVRTFIHTVYCT